MTCRITQLEEKLTHFLIVAILTKCQLGSSNNHFQSQHAEKLTSIRLTLNISSNCQFSSIASDKSSLSIKQTNLKRLPKWNGCFGPFSDFVLISWKKRSHRLFLPNWSWTQFWSTVVTFWKARLVVRTANLSSQLGINNLLANEYQLLFLSDLH